MIFEYLHNRGCFFQQWLAVRGYVQGTTAASELEQLLVFILWICLQHQPLHDGHISPPAGLQVMGIFLSEDCVRHWCTV